MNQSEKLLMRLERLGDEVKVFIAKVAGVGEWKVLEHRKENPVLTNDDMRNLEDFFRQVKLWDGDRFDELFPQGATEGYTVNEKKVPDKTGIGRKDAKVEDLKEID
jgi:hypothetical protein